jgi:hypothetical protein
VAIPDQVQVPSGQHRQRFTPSGFIANSISVLNPNNGVVFVARNRDCISTQVGAWDWKVPSQSYAYLPGPFQSVGLYYQDQSGAATPGDISTYASEQKLDWPHFQAIGLTLASVVTTLDIGQGNQPVPPAANNVRLWADGNGDLHILSSSGTDNLVYDSSNIGNAAVGGDVVGSLSNTFVIYRNASGADVYTSGGTRQHHVTFGTETLWWALGSQYRWVNSTNNVEWARLTVAGFVSDAALQATTFISAGTSVAAGTDIAAQGAVSAGTHVFLSRVSPGALYLDATNTHGFQYRADLSAIWCFTSDLFMDQSIIMGGTGHLYWEGSKQVYMYFNGTDVTMNMSGPWGVAAPLLKANTVVMQGANSIIYMHSNLSVYVQQNYPYFDITGFGYVRCVNGGFVAGNGYYYFSAGLNIAIYWDGTYLHYTHSVIFNATGNQIVWPNGSYISGNAGYVQGSQAALKYSLSSIADDTLLDLVSDPRMVVSTYLFPDVNRRTVGFMAEDVATVLPELAIWDDNGSPTGYVPQELTNILWGAVRALKVRVDELSTRIPA